MTGLSLEALTRMREQFAQFLPDIALIQRLAIVSDSAGGWSELWVLEPGGTVKCRLDPVYSREQIETVADRESTVTEYIITVPYDAPLAPSRRVVVNNVNYQVRTLLTDHSWRVARRAYVSRVD